MKTILEKLLIAMSGDYKIIRVTIREDEHYGKAIVENPNGTPQTWDYNKDSDIWE